MRVSRFGRRVRAQLAFIALTLNLFGVGVPLVHAEVHGEYPLAAIGHADLSLGRAAEVQSDHAGLHQGWTCCKSVPDQFELPVSAVPGVLPFQGAALLQQPVLIAKPASRAPPPGDPARAPPLL